MESKKSLTSFVLLVLLIITLSGCIGVNLINNSGNGKIIVLNDETQQPVSDSIVVVIKRNTINEETGSIFFIVDEGRTGFDGTFYSTKAIKENTDKNESLYVLAMKEGFVSSHEYIEGGVLSKVSSFAVSLNPLYDFEKKENTVKISVLDENIFNEVEGINVKLFSSNGELLKEGKTERGGWFTSPPLNKGSKIYFEINDNQYEIYDAIFNKTENSVKTITLEIEGRVYFPYQIYVKKK